MSPSLSYLAPMRSPEADDAVNAGNIKAALALINAVGDPVKAKAALAKLSEATAAHKAAEKAADEKLAAVERREAALQKRLDDEASDMDRARTEHARRMVDEKRDHEEQIAARVKALEQREKAVAAADAEYVRRFEDLDRRMALIRSAGAM
jgi:hypothetical protein